MKVQISGPATTRNKYPRLLIHTLDLEREDPLIVFATSDTTGVIVSQNKTVTVMGLGVSVSVMLNELGSYKLTDSFIDYNGTVTLSN